MCRHLAYLGPPVAVARAVTDGAHSLVRQSWDPRQMRGGGTVNADGFGACWWSGGPGGERVVGQHRTTLPAWSDPALGRSVDASAGGPGAGRVDGRSRVCGVLEQIAAPAVVAAVRSATPGMPVTMQACAPFTDGVWAFSHNGVVRGWPASTAALAAELGTEDVMAMEAATDSVFLWHLFRARRARGTDAAEALASVVVDVEAAAPGSRLNLLASDGERIVAVAWRHSLWVLDADDAVTVASEPTGAGAWREVPDGTVIDARVGEVSVRPVGMSECSDLSGRSEAKGTWAS